MKKNLKAEEFKGVSHGEDLVRIYQSHLEFFRLFCKGKGSERKFLFTDFDGKNLMK